MAKITVEFALTKSKDSDERVTLSQGDSTIVLNFDNDKAAASLNEDSLYFVRWYFLGAEGDEFNVTWKYGNSSDALINPFKLDGRYARPYPGGKWVDDGTTGFQTPVA